jgi:hypothetical protein
MHKIAFITQYVNERRSWERGLFFGTVKLRYTPGKSVTFMVKGKFNKEQAALVRAGDTVKVVK